MNTPHEFSPETFSLDAEEEAHLACRRYERALQDGQPLAIEEMLAEIQSSFRPLALYELVKVDVEFRRQQGEQPTSSDYDLQIECSNAKSAILTALQASTTNDAQTVSDVDGSPATKASTGGQDTSPDASQRTIPKEVGRYSIAERLGRGGMGTVFKAFDSRLKRFVALKVPHFDKAGDVSIRERFRREALALAALHHDMIVAVHDVEQSGDLEFMTMALIEGETLRRYIHVGRPLAEHQAAILVRALAKAMQYVHGSGVIHRDLKPENVIMEDGRKPVIVDFGLARSPGACELPPTSLSAELGKHVTRFGQVAGTPEYSSPEQLAGDFDAVGPQTDVFSLGVILFELLTGRLPWDGDEGIVPPGHAGDVALQLQACDLNPQVDRDLSAICAKAMDSNLADRYRSMTDFAEALKPFCEAGNKRLEAAEKNTNENINAVLQEIALQAAPKYSRPAEKKSAPQKRQFVYLVFVLLALSAALVVKVRRDGQDEIARLANSSAEAVNASSQAARLQPRFIRPKRSPPETAIGNRGAAGPNERPVTPATTNITVGEPEQPEPLEIGVVATSEAVETPPAWHFAAQQIIEGGGTIVFQIPATDKGWHEKTVREVAGIPQQRQSRIVSVVLTRPSLDHDYPASLRLLCESFPAALRNLELTGIPIDEATIAVVAQAPHLEQLVLRDVGLTGALWNHLSRGTFSSLRRIDLGGNQIDRFSLDLMLTAFEQAAAPLESIGLAGAIAIGKQNVTRIARFPALVRLDLTDAAVAPAALAKLHEATHLAELTLAGVALPEGSAKFLDRLRHLEHANLARTDLSDDALTDLARACQKLTRLKSLDIRNTRFSSAGVLSLANRLGKRDVAVTILAGDRLDFGYRKGARRELAMKYFKAGPGVEPAVTAGIGWLLRNQEQDGLWSLKGPYPNGAAGENRAEATALALLVLQGHGYDGLGKEKFHVAVRRGYRGLSDLVQQVDELSELGPYGNALATLAVCDLHAMAGFHLEDNILLPQKEIVEGILSRCRELQGNDGGWGDKDGSNALVTGWYVQSLTSAKAAGFQVDSDMLVGAKKYIDKLWRADIKRFIYQTRDREKFVLGSHGSAATSLHLIDKLPNKPAESLFGDKHKEAAKDPYFCYYGTRAAVNAGGELWNLWNRNHLKEQLVVEQTMEGPEQGSWFPSNVGDDQGRGCEFACGRFYATCFNLLALEAYYRHLPWTAPVAWRTINSND